MIFSALSAGLISIQIVYSTSFQTLSQLPDDIQSHVMKTLPNNEKLNARLIHRNTDKIIVQPTDEAIQTIKDMIQHNISNENIETDICKLYTIISTLDETYKKRRFDQHLPIILDLIHKAKSRLTSANIEKLFRIINVGIHLSDIDSDARNVPVWVSRSFVNELQMVSSQMLTYFYPSKEILYLIPTHLSDNYFQIITNPLVVLKNVIFYSKIIDNNITLLS
eukprot:389592_1